MKRPKSNLILIKAMYFDEWQTRKSDRLNVDTFESKRLCLKTWHVLIESGRYLCLKASSFDCAAIGLCLCLKTSHMLIESDGYWVGDGMEEPTLSLPPRPLAIYNHCCTVPLTIYNQCSIVAL